ncbi:DUF4279 domain-containing protein [Streptomyces sp. SHP22-7]|nr:DUF4279 domain-containing protein [Streptomyces sp. SHP22-7]
MGPRGRYLGGNGRAVGHPQGRPRPFPSRRADPDAPTSLSVPDADGRQAGLPQEGVWSLAVHKRYPGGVNEQFLELLAQIEPYSSGINRLAAQGYAITISVTGFMGNGSSFTLTPDVVSRMAALNVPLTVSPSTSDR